MLVEELLYWTIWVLVVVSVITFFVLLVRMILNYIDEKHGRQVKNKNVIFPDNQLPAIDIVRDFLEESGCKILNEDEDKESNQTTLNFNYNGGFFMIQCSTVNGEVIVDFPYVLKTSTDMTYKMQSLADRYNDRLKFYKLCTQFNKEENEVTLSVYYETIDISGEALKFVIGHMQTLANEVREEWGKVPKNEEFRLDSQRELFLLSEAEYLHGNKEYEIEVNDNNPLTVAAIIQKLYPDDNFLNLKLFTVITGSRVRRLYNNIDLFEYDLVNLVYKKEEHLIGEPVLLEIVTEHKVYVLRLEGVSDSDYCVYIRVCAMSYNADSYKLGVKSDDTTKAVSFLVAYDKLPEENRQSEFRYMLLDAQDKVKDGRVSDLTDEQRMLINSVSPSKTLYRGVKMFYAERYYEAIWYLEKEFNRQKIFLDESDSMQSFFAELAYFIGFSYYQLHNYEMAVYYLYFTQADFQFRYAMALLDALSEAKDIRIFRETDNMIDSLNNLADNDDLSSEQMSFYEFVLRRKAYAHIQFEDLDEAEKIFKKLLEYPNSKLYAESELLYIEKMRLQQQLDKLEAEQSAETDKEENKE